MDFQNHLKKIRDGNITRVSLRTLLWYDSPISVNEIRSAMEQGLPILIAKYEEEISQNHFLRHHMKDMKERFELMLEDIKSGKEVHYNENITIPQAEKEKQ
tara:strand:+ start:5855 stop:6157 length:303 start_codon:yes stop_codon:yes gene_type:complete